MKFHSTGALLGVLLLASPAFGYSTRDYGMECSEKGNGTAWNALTLFCTKITGGPDGPGAMVPSDSIPTVGTSDDSKFERQARVSLSGNCDPPELITMEVCLHRFSKMCALGDPDGRASAQFGKMQKIKHPYKHLKHLLHEKHHKHKHHKHKHHKHHKHKHHKHKHHKHKHHKHKHHKHKHHHAHKHHHHKHHGHKHTNKNNPTWLQAANAIRKADGLAPVDINGHIITGHHKHHHHHHKHHHKHHVHKHHHRQGHKHHHVHKHGHKHHHHKHHKHGHKKHHKHGHKKHHHHGHKKHHHHGHKKHHKHGHKKHHKHGHKKHHHKRGKGSDNWKLDSRGKCQYWSIEVQKRETLSHLMSKVSDAMSLNPPESTGS